MKQVGNTILAKGVNHILAKRDNSAWPKGAKLSGFSSCSFYNEYDEKEYAIEWSVQVHVFACFWAMVKAYHSDVFERKGKLEDYGEWLAKELLEKLEEEEQ